ncbi:TetR/AcrR family transcriptional regulator [Oceaniserpentilla sp. 4NH20-0058]|uniref:TetR/AcrR family transcriptional regulator n=1 Tax=Oceaniserpentilla sp. 4NH20-0058 TaxID=3127660 RepID=UPI003341C750
MNTPETPKKSKIRERNSQQIIEAAEAEFVLHGFKGTSMQSIADRAGLPKANIHYYFKNKANLYQALLENILERWTELLTDMHADSDPKDVLSRFIRNKLHMSFTQPNPSKIFAMEIIQGAPYIRQYLRTDLRDWVNEKVSVIHQWIEQGKIANIDPTQLIFMIWATTQHYADFNVQVLGIMDKEELTEKDYQKISDSVTNMILSSCGLQYPRKKGGF